MAPSRPRHEPGSVGESTSAQPSQPPRPRDAATVPPTHRRPLQQSTRDRTRQLRIGRHHAKWARTKFRPALTGGDESSANRTSRGSTRLVAGRDARTANGSETSTASASVRSRTRCSTRDVRQSRMTPTASQLAAGAACLPAARIGDANHRVVRRGVASVRRRRRDPPRPRRHHPRRRDRSPRRRSGSAEGRGEQPPVPLGDDLDVAVDDLEGGLIVDRVRRTGDAGRPAFCLGHGVAR